MGYKVHYESKARFTSAMTRGSIPVHNSNLHALLRATLDPRCC
jgi:hypothetical protein